MAPAPPLLSPDPEPGFPPSAHVTQERPRPQQKLPFSDEATGIGQGSTLSVRESESFSTAQ